MASVREAFFNFRGNANDLIRELRQIRAEVAAVPKSKKFKIEASRVDVTKAKLESLREVVEELETETHDVKVAADLKRLAIDLAKANTLINTLPNRKVVTVEAEVKLGRDLDRVENLIQGVVGKLGALASASSQAGHTGFNFSQAFGESTSVIRKLGPVVAGVSILLISALVPALLACVAAVGGLVGALAGLGSALVAGLGPAAIVFIGVLQRLSAIMEAFQTRKQAMEGASRGSAATARAEAAANETLRNAQNAASNAAVDAQRATEDLTAARQQAAAAIEDARQAEADAIQATGEAVRNLRDAEVAAYREIKDAINAAKHAVLDLESAQLGIAEADLSLDKARADLAAFRQELGLSASAINGMFKKFEDVDFDPGKMDAILAAEVGTDVSGDDMLELREKILAVERAEIGLKQSHLGAKDAQTANNRAQAEANRLKKEGLNGVASYRSAVQGLASATRAQTEASKRLADLEKAGVERSPGVIAAKRAQADADRRLKEARHDVGVATKKLNSVEAGGAGNAALYKEQRDKLSEAETGLLDVIIGLSNAYKILQPLTDKVIGGITSGLDKLSSKLSVLPAALDSTAQAMSDSINSMVDNLGSLENTKNFGEIINFSPALIGKLTDLINGLVNSVLRLGAAALPLANEFLGHVARDLNRLSSTPISELRAQLKPMFELLTIVYDLFIAIGDAVISAFSAGSEPINEFFKFFRDGARSFAKFAKSGKGAESIKEFFEDTLPFVQSFLQTLKLIGAIFLKVFQILGPILKPVLDTFNFFLKALLLLLKALDWLIGPFKGVIGFVLALFIGVNKLLLPLRLLSKLFTAGFGAIGRVIANFGRGVASKIAAPFRNAWRLIRQIFAGIKNSVSGKAIVAVIRATGGGIIRVLTWPFRTAWNLIKAAFKAASSTLGRILATIVNNFKALLRRIREFVQPLLNVAQRVFDGWKRIFGALGRVIGKAFGTGVNIAKGVINLFIKGMNRIIGLINKIPNIKVLGVKLGIPDLPKIPLLAAGGLATGPTLGVFGEAGDEAVLPLTKAVYDRLAQGILRALNVERARSSVLAARKAPRAPRATQETKYVNNHFNVPPGPAGEQPDPRYVVSQMAMLMGARGLA